MWGCGDGSTLPVVPTPVGRAGAVICWENYMPLLRTAKYGKGVEIWGAPTADARDTWIARMRHIALEGRCYVLSCNQFARRRDYPADYASTFGYAPDTVISRGPDYSGETILVAELHRAEIARAKMGFDAVGHYARPDVFSLHVDERPRHAVRYDVGNAEGSNPSDA